MSMCAKREEKATKMTVLVGMALQEIRRQRDFHYKSREMLACKAVVSSL